MESKYINQETSSFLQSQLGQTTPQRLEALEITVKNIADYIEQQQKFLADYEAYLDGELAKKADLRDQIEQASVVATISDRFQADTKVFASKLTNILYLAIASVGLTLGLAAAYFLK